MSLSNSRLAYTAEYSLLDRAVEAERGIRIEVPSIDAAYYLRMRIHHARSIDRADNKNTYQDQQHPLHGRSPYDILVCRIEGEAPAWVYLDKVKVEIGTVEEIPLDYALEFKAPLLIEGPKAAEPKTELPMPAPASPGIRRR